MLIERVLEQLGAKIERIPVGPTFLTLEAKRRNAVLGIESSGHFVLPSLMKKFVEVTEDVINALEG